MPDRVFVFDLDDTLYLERDYVRSGFRHIGQVVEATYEVSGVADYAWGLFESGVRGNTFDRVIAHFGLPKAALPLLVAEYREHDPALRLQVDAQTFLQNLPSDVVGTGLITDGYAAGQWRKLRALGLTDSLDQVVVTGEHGSDWTKPSERAFRHVQERYPQRGIEFVYFADNPAKDFHAPLSLGWRAVRVRRPLGLHYLVDDVLTVHETIRAFGEPPSHHIPTTERGPQK